MLSTYFSYMAVFLTVPYIFGFEHPAKETSVRAAAAAAAVRLIKLDFMDILRLLILLYR